MTAGGGEAALAKLVMERSNNDVNSLAFFFLQNTRLFTTPAPLPQSHGALRVNFHTHIHVHALAECACVFYHRRFVKWLIDCQLKKGRQPRDVRIPR